MIKKPVLNRLSSLKTPLEAVEVLQLGLFCSTVRGENTRKSDIDILIDLSAGRKHISILWMHVVSFRVLLAIQSLILLPKEA